MCELKERLDALDAAKRIVFSDDYTNEERTVIEECFERRRKEIVNSCKGEKDVVVDNVEAVSE